MLSSCGLRFRVGGVSKGALGEESRSRAGAPDVDVPPGCTEAGGFPGKGLS